MDQVHNPVWFMGIRGSFLGFTPVRGPADSYAGNLGIPANRDGWQNTMRQSEDFRSCSLKTTANKGLQRTGFKARRQSLLPNSYSLLPNHQLFPYLRKRPKNIFFFQNRNFSEFKGFNTRFDFSLVADHYDDHIFGIDVGFGHAFYVGFLDF